MFKLPFRKPQPKTERAESCPTRPCPTCQAPLPIVSYDQRCMRCQSVVAAARSCPGACSGCEMGE